MIFSKNKKGLEMSFTWIFAIIVGIFILFLAIYGVTKLIKTEQTTMDAKTAKEIGVLLNPLETGFEDMKTNTLIMPVETRIYNRCHNITDTFGRQGIMISQKSFGEWTATDLEVTFYNKYIFSDTFAEGKTFYLFSKPFKFPFKVADLIYLTSASKKYCFTGLEGDDDLENIKDDLISDETLFQKNILVEDCADQKDIVNVCFGTGSNCDIRVSYNTGKYVEKDGEHLYFGNQEALMYAAIFSDSKIYKCQLQRLMERTAELATLYQGKATFIASKNCYTDVDVELSQLISYANEFRTSSELSNLETIVDNINRKNTGYCKLW